MKKQILSAVTAGILAVSMAAPALTALAESETVTDSSQVTLTGTKTPKGTKISMTVPTTIPLGVSAETHKVSTGSPAISNAGEKGALIKSVSISDKSSAFTFIAASNDANIGKEEAANKIYAKIYDASDTTKAKGFDLSKTTVDLSSLNWTVDAGDSVTLTAEGDTGLLNDNYKDEQVATINWTFEEVTA